MRFFFLGSSLRIRRGAGQQCVLIEDTRFVRAGLRPDGVFLGKRDYHGDPLPEFIGALPDNLADLMGGLAEANDRMARRWRRPDPEGRGGCLRVYRPTEVYPRDGLPVSSALLDGINAYRATL
jgi:hypothetical protein